MNNDKINRLKKAYFSGNSTKEDEKWLKENSGDPLFTALKEEKDQGMDWSFADFMAVTGQEESTQRIGVFSFRKMIYWSAAAAALLVAGLLLFQDTGTQESLVAKNESQPELPVQPTEETTDVPDAEEINTEKTEKPVKKVTRHRQKKITPQPEENAYHPEYVVINGKPIYDMDEARELTMSSLNLLASNMEKSVSGMENIKYLSIKF